jgi:hypothetical protein
MPSPPCFAPSGITISPLRLLVQRVAFVRCLDSAIRKHEGVPSSHRLATLLSTLQVHQVIQALIHLVLVD